MGKSMVRFLAAAVCCFCLTFAGQAGAAEAGKTAKSGGAKQDRFEKCDTNKDNFWSKDEFKECFKRMKPENVDKRFAAVDTDKDSKISKAEWEAVKAKRAEKRAAKPEKKPAAQ